MNNSVIILGGGGHARVLIDILQAQSTIILGIVEKDSKNEEKLVDGVKVLGGEEIVYDYDPTSILLVNGVGSVETTGPRRKVFLKFKKKGYTFLSVIHQTATIAKSAHISEGVQIMAGVVVQPGCVIGENSIINTKAAIDHDCHIGAHSHIAPGATLSGEIHIEENVHIGTGANIIQGIKIGKNSLIGAGTLVLQDVPDNKVVLGVPGKVRDKKS